MTSIINKKGIKMKKIFLLLPAFLSLPAYADGNFIGANFGSAFGYPNSTDTIPRALISAGAPSASAQQKAGSLGGSIYIGKWFNESVGWEWGYNYLGGGIDGSYKAAPLTGTYNYSASAFHWAVLGGIPSGSGKFYGKAGFYSAKTNSEWSIAGRTSSSGSNGNLGLLLGVGYEEALSQNFSTRFGVDLYNGVKFQEVAHGTDANQNLFRISLGLNLKY